VNASALTTMNAVVGTSGYVSPEQLGWRELTSRIDVFALGGVLVFAATAHGPFDAPDLPAVIGHILSQLPDLSSLTGSLHDIGAYLDKEPASRPAVDDLFAYFSAADRAPWRPRGSLEKSRGTSRCFICRGLPASGSVFSHCSRQTAVSSPLPITKAALTCGTPTQGERRGFLRRPQRSYAINRP